MKKLMYAAILLSSLLAIAGCGEEETVKPSITHTEGPFTFLMPEDFILDEEDSTDEIKYFHSTPTEATKVIYSLEPEISSVSELDIDKLIKEANEDLKEEYLTNAKIQLLSHTTETVGDVEVFRYTTEYSLFSAIVTHHHIYAEKDGQVYQLEYTDVEEEGYQYSFYSYDEQVTFQ